MPAIDLAPYSDTEERKKLLLSHWGTQQQRDRLSIWLAKAQKELETRPDDSAIESKKKSDDSPAEEHNASPVVDSLIAGLQPDQPEQSAVKAKGTLTSRPSQQASRPVVTPTKSPAVSIPSERVGLPAVTPAEPIVISKSPSNPDLSPSSLDLPTILADPVRADVVKTSLPVASPGAKLSSIPKGSRPDAVDVQSSSSAEILTHPADARPQAIAEKSYTVTRPEGPVSTIENYVLIAVVIAVLLLYRKYWMRPRRERVLDEKVDRRLA